MSAPLRKYLRRMWRAQLGPDALLTLNEAAEALPGNPRLARAWVLAHVTPCGDIDGIAVYRWGDLLVAVSGAIALTPASAEPVTRWKDAAATLGVSEDTLARRRRDRDPDRACYFDTAAELRAWWKGLVAPIEAARPARTPRPGSPSKRSGDGPVDWTELGKALSGGRR